MANTVCFESGTTIICINLCIYYRKRFLIIYLSKKIKKVNCFICKCNTRDWFFPKRGVQKPSSAHGTSPKTIFFASCVSLLCLKKENYMFYIIIRDQKYSIPHFELYHFRRRKSVIRFRISSRKCEFKLDLIFKIRIIMRE